MKYVWNYGNLRRIGINFHFRVWEMKRRRQALPEEQSLFAKNSIGRANATRRILDGFYITREETMMVNIHTYYTTIILYLT